MEDDINILEGLNQSSSIVEFADDSLNCTVRHGAYIARWTDEDPHLHSLGN
jgi:hypothetical protein